MNIKSLFILGLFIVFGQLDAFEKAELKQTFERRCLKCHGALNSKGNKIIKADLDLSDIFSSPSEENLKILKKSFKLILANKMPPEDAKPLGSLREGTLKSLSNYFKVTSPKTGLSTEEFYRADRFELKSKFENLLKINLSFSNALENIPDNLKINRSEKDPLLNQYFLKKYIDAVDSIVDGAFEIDSEANKPVKKEYFPPLFHIEKKKVTQKRNNGVAENIIWYGSPNTNNGIVAVEKLHSSGVPHSGYYEIEVTAKAQNRAKLPDSITYVNSSMPLRLGILTGLSRKGGKTTKPTWYKEANQKYLAEFDLEDEEFKTYKVTAWLEKYYYPRLTYRNGSIFGNMLVNRLRKGQKERLPPGLHAKYISETDAQRIYVKSLKISSLPHEESKLFEIFGEEGNNPKKFNLNVLNFASKAYQKSLKDHESELLLKSINNYRDVTGLSLIESYKYAVKYILASSKMLYRSYPKSIDEFKAYNSQALTGSSVGFQDESLDKIVASPEINYFVERFMNFWLHVDKSKAIIPDIRDAYYREYFREHIKDYALKESYLTFLYLLRNNRSALELLNSDYRILNKPLAKFYDVEFDTDSEIPKLSKQESLMLEGNAESVRFYLVNKKNAGGLISQSAILNLTSDEVATNPILRGAWILEEMLGVPLRVPPADVAAFEPDLRSAKTIKEQLQAHKALKSCASCHTDMDPLGLALEMYDNIGQFRTHYKNNKQVDAEVELFEETVNNSEDYKAVIRASKSEIFVMNLAEKLLEYFLKRRVTDKEYFKLFEDIKFLAPKNYPLKDLVKIVFSQKRLVNE